MIIAYIFFLVGQDHGPDWAKGRAMLNEGKWTEAQQFYEAILAEDADQLQAKMMLGIIDLNQGDYASAIAAFQTAIDGQFLVFVNRLYLAKAQALGGQKEAAFATLETWVQAGIGDFSKLQTDPALASLREEPGWAEILKMADRTARPCAFDPNKQIFQALQGHWQVFDGYGNLFADSTFTSELGSCVLVEKFIAHYANTEWTIYWSAGEDGQIYQAWFTDKGRQGRMIGSGDLPWRFLETRLNPQGEEQCNCMQVSAEADGTLLMISLLSQGKCSDNNEFRETGRMIYRPQPVSAPEKTK